MNSFLRYSLLTLVGGFFSLTVLVGSAKAATVEVSCSGTSGSPTAVTEADLAGDDVTFTDGGDGWCVLDEAISAASVVVSTGVTITHVAGDIDGVTITTTGIFSLQTGAAIDVTAKGCQGGEFGAQNGYGPDLGTGACTISTSGYGKPNRGGAAHAGAGGDSTFGGNSQPAIYGSVTAPLLLGSGGGGGPNPGETGGTGGGKIRLDIGGVFTVNGTISANGGNGDNSGGGSGGSVYITAGTLRWSEGDGTITANGGSTTLNGGGGGGGYTAVYYGALDGFTITNIIATKGIKGGSNASTDGGVGSTFLLDRVVDDGVGTLSITSGLRLSEAVDSLRSNVTVYSGAVISCESFATLNFGASTALSFQGVTFSCDTVDTVNFYASTWTTSGTNSISFAKTGAQVNWNISNNLTVNNLTYTGGSAGTTSGNGGLLTFSNAINVSLINSIINSSVNWDGIVNLTLDASSQINATGKGCGGGVPGSADGYGPNTTTNICGQGVSGYAVQRYGGAAHAGTGGRGNWDVGSGQTVTYGTNTTPVLFGSGGSGGSNPDENGGSGGGKIRLNITGALTLGGSIVSNGVQGGAAVQRSGGGSGGSIYITVGSISGSGGTMTVTGGQGGQSYSGGGGGGRIALYFGANTDFNLLSMTAVGGAVSSSSPGDAVAGGDGTVFTLQTVSLTSITITDNSGYTNDSTPVITLLKSGATPTHVAFSCNAGSNWSDWIVYPDDDVVNDGDGPAFDITSGATGCSATNELKTISAKIKNADGESSVISDTTTYDTVAPTVSSVSATNVNGTYGADTVITVTVQFSDSMAVTGTPQIRLDMNGTDREAGYVSVTTDTLSFAYTIVNGDNKTDLDYTGSGALTLNSGTITDLAGNTATLTLPAPGTPNSLGSNKDINIVTSPEVNWSVASQSGAESVGTLTVTANLSFTYASDVTILYTLTGTAVSPSDYSITASPLVITAGNASGSITITVTDDVIDELDETIIVTMGSPTNGIKGATDVHTATITDNDVTPTIAINDPTVSEGAGTGTVTVTLTGGSYLGVTVNYTTSSGSAISGTDFTATSGTLTWVADESGAKTFTVAITNDVLNENSETINLTLSVPVNATISDSAGVMTITDNDTAPTVSWTTSAQASVNESGTLTFTAQLSAVSGLTVTVPYTMSGTATGSGVDYSITASPITITAGSTTADVTITITEERIVEPDETVIVTIGSPTNASQGATIIHTATITRDDVSKTYPNLPSTVGGSVTNSVSVSSPFEGEEIVHDSMKTIRWSSTGTFNFVNLYYSIDGGITYQVIERNLVNTGSCTWIIPNEVGATVIIKIEGTDLATVLDTDTASFSIINGVVTQEDEPVSEEGTIEEQPTEEEAEEQISIIGMALEEVLGNRWLESAEKSGIAEIFPNFPTSVAIGTLIKLPDDGDPKTQTDSAVYYVGADHRRHPFPNESVYKSWFSTFYGIKNVDIITMAQIPVGPLVTFRPGSTLIKFPSVPKVYSIDATGALRWLTSETVAVSLYGNDWSKIVQDVSEGFWSSYDFGEDLMVLNDQNWDTIMAKQ